MQLNIETDDKAIKHFNKLLRKQATPTATYRAINEVLKWSLSESVKATKSELKLPSLKIIKKRFTQDGREKGDRLKLTKATKSKLDGNLWVYMRGIPVSLIAGKQTKTTGGGVKAKGGRFYKGAFYAKGQVFKRQGKERSPLMVPKIGVRKSLTKHFDNRLTGGEGHRQFIKRWNRLMAHEIKKAKL